MQHSPRFEALCEAARKNVTEVSIDELKGRLDRGDTFHLIDVREESEVAKGRLPTAKAVGRGILERDIEKAVPELDADIVLYCGGGYRSALAAESLEKMGYTKVTSMAGGWRGWTEKGYPTEK